MTDCKADVRIVRAGAERIEQLAPLYAALHAHHRTIAPTLARMPARSPEEAWQRRRERYARWLAAPGAFVLVAESERRPVGFALVTIEPGYDGWQADGDLGEIRDLAVTPERRGDGIGTRLMDAVEQQLSLLGIRHYRLTVLASNEQASRFYARRGMTTASRTLVAGPLPQWRR